MWFYQDTAYQKFVKKKNMKNYEQLIADIKARSNPENLLLEKGFENELSLIQYGNVEKYIRLAMHGVDPKYTAKIREAGEKVKGHLREVLTRVTYKYQGSVETNTHIVATSDIDLLAITDEFWTPNHNEINSILNDVFKKQALTHTNIALLESAVRPPFFEGDSLQILRNNRLLSERKLESVYNHCDTSKDKAIQITNQSLRKEVDVVIANWFDDANSILNKKGVDYRGIQIYNKGMNVIGDPDFPFLKIKLLNEKSALTNGRLKKMIRFLKNVKAGLNKDQKPPVIKWHKSFQFNAICYAIPTSTYAGKNIFELVTVVYGQLEKLYWDHGYRNELQSVDDSGYIYRNEPDVRSELKSIMDAILPIIHDLQNQRIL